MSLYVEPGAGSHFLVRLIDRAQRRIFLSMYILSDAPIMHALERAEAQGVEVWVALEPHPFGLPSQPRSVAERLRAAGVHVRWTSPGFALTHAKFAVLDDATAIISTANFTGAGFHADRDFILVDRRARDVYSLSSLFRWDWDRLPVLLNDPDMLVSPLNARFKLAALLRLAHRSIDMDAEEVGDAGMENLLAAARRRRIMVRILLPPGASSNAVAYLRRHHVLVRVLRAPYIHAKTLIVDATRAYVGSENFSTYSLDRNREVGLLVSGSTARALERRFRLDWSLAR